MSSRLNNVVASAVCAVYFEKSSFKKECVYILFTNSLTLIASAFPPEPPVRQLVQSSRAMCCFLLSSTDRGECNCKYRIATGGLEEIREYLDHQGS